MRVVVVGATGNVGTSVLEALAAEPRVDEVMAIARRAPGHDLPKAVFAQADIVHDDLESLFARADVVIHLAWLIQPGRDERITEAVNVRGSERVFAAAAAAGVPALVYASSVGAYSPGPKDRLVDETWPTEGIASSFYSRHKVAVERLLDRLEADQPALRVVRLRPALIFKSAAATEIRRLFLGPFVPGWLLRPSRVPVVPDVERLRFQAVHSADVGLAYARAAVGSVRGAFNLAAEPVLDPAVLSELFGARRIRVPAGVLRTAASLTFAARLQPTEPGWLDMALSVPLMDVTRARTELGWDPAHSATEALVELLDGLADGADYPTPPLAAATTGPARLRELRTGVGQRP